MQTLQEIHLELLANFQIELNQGVTDRACQANH